MIDHPAIPYPELFIENATLDDLVRITGKSRGWCKEQIRAGKLPGRHVGQAYVVPDIELHLWRLGQWEPRPVEAIQPPSLPGKPRKMLHSVPPLKSTG